MTDDAMTHQCKGCNTVLPVHVPYCMTCVSRLNNQGLCGLCGTRPLNADSRYCDSCSSPVPSKTL